MRPRHRIPSIFSLSMVDILCCALGCVILLWLLNLREAQQQASSSGRFAEKLKKTQEDLASLQKDHTALLAALEENEQKRQSLDLKLEKANKDQALAASELKDAREKLALLTTNKTELEKQLALTQKDRNDLQKKLTSAEKELASASADLKKNAALLLTRREAMELLTRKSTDLQKELLAIKTDRDRLKTESDKIPDLEKALKAALEKLKAETALSTKLNGYVTDYKKQLNLTAKEIEQLRADRDAMEADLRRNSKQLASTREQITSLEKDLLAQARKMIISNRTISDLRKERDTLVQIRARLQNAMDQRFAGIELTGRNVIFLVDISGSMKLLQDRIEAKDKWPKVQQTLARIMRSLPNLEKFQIIAFAEETSFPLGSKDQWLPYKGPSSITATLKRLASINPTGGTDMHTALQAAFRYREKNLDTIYLLSDGLPNLGEGVPLAEAKKLTTQEISNRLAKYLRAKLKTEWNNERPGKSKVRIHGVGFFFESPDVGAFLWALARENNGSFVGMSQP